jgi:hypothetical protein
MRRILTITMLINQLLATLAKPQNSQIKAQFGHSQFRLVTIARANDNDQSPLGQRKT